MSWLQLSHVNEMLNGTMYGIDVALDGVFTDTREANSKGLFFALPGPNFDPHEILNTACDAVAAALVVNRRVDHPAPQIVVPDTYHALSQLAGVWRQSFIGPVVGLTGSNGKTTLKEMLASILRTQGEVLVTKGNLNNHIGVPLTLLGLRDEYQYAVVEMGANKPGDIAELTALVKPDIAIITNASSAHLEGFGSVENVAACKGEIFEGLDINGMGVINKDDKYADFWQWLARSYRTSTFGEADAADIKIEGYNPATFRCDDKLISAKLKLKGRHNVRNAAAAIAAAVGLGLPIRDAVAGLQNMQPVDGRLLSITGPSNSQIIDDSYNANPGSMRAAIEVLADESGYKILVMGDMAELGDAAKSLHKEIGRVAALAEIDLLLTYGDFAAIAGSAFTGTTQHFDSHTALAEELLKHIGDATVLVKGSRSAQMEKVILALRDIADFGPQQSTQGEADHAA